jgi:hypothetical protein
MHPKNTTSFFVFEKGFPVLDVKSVQQRIIYLGETFKAFIELRQKDVLTKTESRKLASLEQELGQILEPVERSDLTVDVATVARFFNVTVRQVQNWAKEKGCPKLKHGIYDLRAVFEWWFEEIVGGDSKEISDVKLEYWREKMLRERLKRGQEEGSLIPRGQIVSIWASRVGEVTSGLEALASRLPPLLQAKTQAEMFQTIKDEVWQLRNSYARGGEYCPELAGAGSSNTDEEGAE